MRNSINLTSWFMILSLGVILSACGDGDDGTIGSGTSDDLRERFTLQTLGPIPYPPDNPRIEERVALGRLLFFDPILGGEMDVSCGTCHHPQFAFADGRQFGAGVSGLGLGPDRLLSRSALTELPIKLEPRNTPTVFNTAFNADETGLATHEGLQFWDGRVNSLEVQATKPITSRVEMRGDAYPGSDDDAAAASLDSVLARLNAIPGYVERFRVAFPEAFPSLPFLIDSSMYVRAIGAYERELITDNSPYDRYVRGDDNALSAVQKDGLELFFTKAKCNTCHSGPMFSDFRFIVQGVPQVGGGKGTIPGDDLGREEFTGEMSDRYAFRTPTLRNVELTQPYMHDGAFGTLTEVMDFYNDGGHPRHPDVSDAMLDPILVDPLELSEAELIALVEFMKALTDPGTNIQPQFLITVPEEVPSGLMPVFGLRGTGPGRASATDESTVPTP